VSLSTYGGGLRPFGVSLVLVRSLGAFATIFFIISPWNITVGRIGILLCMCDYWQRQNTKVLFKHPRLTVVEDNVVLPTGSKTKYLRYEGLQDYVTVIAVQNDRVAFIKEFSYPHNEWLWQFPEGSIESGEDPVMAADRELQEEAGLKARNIERLGLNYSHHRRSTEKNYVLLASEITTTKKPIGDEEEYGTETYWITLAELKNMINRGEIVQKNALSALALYFAHQNSNLSN
jgi:8-oxo-dGTP pyrophosphatase MutT (NUDIX family)